MPPVVKAKAAAKTPDVEPETPDVEPETPDVEPEEGDDPDTQWIVYREPITTQVNVPGQGPTAVQSYVEHRVPLTDWPEYEKALNESKKGL